MTATPPTRFAGADGAAVAYQVVGDGPRDIVFVPGMLSHIELWWEQPAFADTFMRIASMARLILYDRRGTGLSGGDAVPTLDERIADLAAVMDAAGSDRAVIFGPSDGAATALLFAVTHPDRCSHLILYGAQATGLRDDEYPWGVTEEELELVVKSIKYEWGRGGTLALQAPTLSGDESMVEWWARFERLGIREGQLVPSLRAMAKTDVRDLLPLVTVPTLVSHCAGDLVMPVDGARYLASHIPGARLVELPGYDHLAIFSNAEAMVGSLRELLQHDPEVTEPAPRVATVVVADCLGAGSPCGELLERAAALEREMSGRPFVSEANHARAVAGFDGAAAAVRHAAALRQAARDAERELRVGVHTDRCDVHGSEVAGPAPDVASALVAEAQAGEVLVTRSTRNLLAAADIELDWWGSLREHAKGGERSPLPVYSLA